MATEIKTIAKNRKAFHEYEVMDRFDAGLVLTGTEVRSLRDNHCQLTDSFILIRGGEAWLNNLHITPFLNGNINNVDPDRRRKLLLHKKEILQLEKAVQEKGMAIIPIELFFSKNALVKVKIAIARGKKLHDKRASAAKRDSDREIARAMKENYR